MTLIYFTLIIVGLSTLVLWGVGSHGHIRFRPHMLEDWVLAAIVLICFGIPIRSWVVIARSRKK